MKRARTVSEGALRRVIAWFKRMPLVRKMMMLTIFALLVPCVVLSALLFHIEIRTRMEREITRNETVLRTMAMDIRKQMTYVESVIALMAENQQVRTLLTNAPQRYGELAVFLLYEISDVLKSNTAYLRAVDASIMIITPGENIPEIYTHVMREESMLMDGSYRTYVESGAVSMWGDVGYFMPPERLNTNFYVEMKLPYYAGINAVFPRRMGVIKCSISPSRLFQSVLPWMDQSALMVYQHDTVIWKRGADYAAPPRVEEEMWIDAGTMYVPYAMDEAALSLVLAMDYRAIQRQVILSILPFYLLVLQGVLVMSIIVRSILHSTLGHLRTTVKAIGQIDENHTRIQLPEGNPDEIGLLICAFNKLLDSLNRQHVQILEKEIGKQQAQVLALQHQMNPHFLFNSLHWLQLQAELGEINDHFSNAIALLGDILHYNLTAEPYAPVTMEIAHIELYIAFVRMWRETDIQLSVDCSDHAKELLIPRFTLQPIVENAVWHGLIPGQCLSIEIQIHATDAFTEIRIQNDGRPLTAAQLEDMRRRVAPEGALPMDRGVGMSNLSRRLYLTYGAEAFIAVEQGVMGQPMITLHIPAC